MPAIPEVTKHSVTKDDNTDKAGRKGAVLHFWIPAALGGIISLPPYPPGYWSWERDDTLRATKFYESMWASALYIAVSKISAMSYEVTGDVALQVKRAQELMLEADEGMGWVQFVQKHLQDFLLTDNGAFIEIVRSSSAAGSRILGLVPLDSRRCQRTGDPDVPIIYRDLKNNMHEMKTHQIIMMSDMPSSTEPYFGVGFCAASRAYRAIYKLAALETYVAEKVSGRRPLALHFINNVTQEQIDNAIRDSENQANQRGQQAYMGAVVVSNIDPSVEPHVETIELAGLPDGFDAQQERRHAILSYADAVGFDPQELDPELLASKAQGTGSQAKVIDDKASGKGLVAYRQQLTHKLNWEVLSKSVSFYFHETDARDRQMGATIDGVIIDNMTKMQAAGTLDSVESRNYLVDKDVLDRDYMPVDITPTMSLSDSDKIPPDVLSEEEREQAILDLYEADMMQQQAEQAVTSQVEAPEPGVPMPGADNDEKRGTGKKSNQSGKKKPGTGMKSFDDEREAETHFSFKMEPAINVTAPKIHVDAPDMGGVVSALDRLLKRPQPTPVVNVTVEAAKPTRVFNLAPRPPDVHITNAVQLPEEEVTEIENDEAGDPKKLTKRRNYGKKS